MSPRPAAAAFIPFAPACRAPVSMTASTGASGQSGQSGQSNQRRSFRRPNNNYRRSNHSRPDRGRQQSRKPVGPEFGPTDVDLPDQPVFPVSRKDSRKGPSSASPVPRSNSATHKAALGALDAVDRLFNKINKTTPRTAPSSSEPSPQDSPQDSPQLNRATWLDDVRARAATATHNHSAPPTPSNQSTELPTVDVPAVEQPPDQSSSADNGHLTFTQRTAALSVSNHYGDGADRKTYSRFRDSTFENLMRITRNGPVGELSSKGRRLLPPRSATRESDAPVAVSEAARLGNLSPDRPATLRTQRQRSRNATQKSGANSGGGRDGGRDGGGRDGGGRDKDKLDMSRLLGLTKEIFSNQNNRGKQDTSDGDYEPIDEEMDRVIEIKGKRVKDATRRQKFSAVRRVAGTTRRILSPPEAWQPLTVEDVSRVSSDHRALGGGPMRNSGGKRPRWFQDVSTRCTECDGTGMEVCSVCVGEGWLVPVEANARREMDESRLLLLDQVWSLPNLVVNSRGEAQCVRCNGLGKQFCSTCTGSGSSLKKGFNLSDKYRVFDMFVGSKDGPSLDEIDFDVISDNSDEEGENGEDDEAEVGNADGMESFQLYRGSPEILDVLAKKTAREKDNDADVLDVDDDEDEVMDVEDESAELLATLEAMHMADLEDRGPSLDERLGIRIRPSPKQAVDADVEVGKADDDALDVDINMDVKDIAHDEDEEDDEDDDGDDGIDDMENIANADEVVEDIESIEGMEDIGQVSSIVETEDEDEDEDEDVDEDDLDVVEAVESLELVEDSDGFGLDLDDEVEGVDEDVEDVEDDVEDDVDVDVDVEVEDVEDVEDVLDVLGDDLAEEDGAQK